MLRTIGIRGTTVLAALSTFALAAPANAQPAPRALATAVELVSVGPGGVYPNNQADDPAISGDGSAVAFSTHATNLGGGADPFQDVFVRDRGAATTTLVSVDDGGGPADGSSSSPSISQDGRRIAFLSTARDLVADDDSIGTGVYVRDLDTGDTELVSVATDGGGANGGSSGAAISADGEHVVFSSDATNLVPGDSNGFKDVFVRHLESGTTELVSISTTGGPSNHVSGYGAISADGRLVAFDSVASNISAGPHNFLISDIFVRDLDTDVTTLLTLDEAGNAADGDSHSARISGDGTRVAFTSFADDLAPTPPGDREVFVLDRGTGDIAVASATPDGGSGNDTTVLTLGALSHDGRYLAMDTDATDLVLCGTMPGAVVRDLQSGVTDYVLRRPDGSEGGGRSPTISADGTEVGLETGGGGFLPSPPLHSLAWVASDLEFGPHPLFSDVLDTHPFRCDIEWLVDHEIAAGFPDGTFVPTLPLSRQAMAAFLYRFAGEPAFDPPSTPTFPDVATDHAFFLEIEWLAAEGVTTGSADGTFGPTRSVQRQSMAAFLYRLAGEPDFDPPTTPTFPDLDTDDVFFLEIEWLASVGVAEGFDDETFRPTFVVSRQAMAAYLHRYADWQAP
jgi:Tol biopolymer transport system component